MPSLLGLLEEALVRLGNLHVAKGHSWGVRSIVKEVFGLRVYF